MSISELEGSQEPLEKKVHLPKTSESESLKRIRHTASHVMAMAVQKLFPKAQVTIGPWIENGFYYDFDSPEPFTEKDLKSIQKEMVKIIKETPNWKTLEIEELSDKNKVPVNYYKNMDK